MKLAEAVPNGVADFRQVSWSFPEESWGHCFYGQASLRNPASFSTFAKVGFRPINTVADIHWWNL